MIFLWNTDDVVEHAIETVLEGEAVFPWFEVHIARAMMHCMGDTHVEGIAGTRIPCTDCAHDVFL